MTISPPLPARRGTAFGCSRNFLGNRFVYVVVSPRARGLSIGINLNPDRYCNFDCIYCEVDRTQPLAAQELDFEVLGQELQRTLDLVRSGAIIHHPSFQNMPSALLKLQHVAMSGDGEPTLCQTFQKVTETVLHVRARRGNEFFKVVLITNGTGLDLPEVQAGLKAFTRRDEIWVKLEAGTQEYMNRLNRSDVPLEKVMANILLISREFPVVIQSLFPMINGEEPEAEEIQQFAQRLKELKEQGAKIPLVQIYSATRPTVHSECGHLPLKTLSNIAQVVREVTGLKAEVF